MAGRNWLSQLTSGIDDRSHPLGTESGLKEFHQTLPASQPGLAVSQICDALDQAREAKVSAPAFQRALAALDEAAQPALAELRHTMFHDPRGDRISEVSQRALAAYARHMAGLYLYALDLLQAPLEGDDAISRGALNSLRAMRCAMEIKKLGRIAYQAPDLELWRLIHRIHARAGELKVQRVQTPVLAQAYAGNPERVSVQHEYVAGLLFETAPLGGLLPTQIECLDLLVRRYAPVLLWSEKPAPEVPFHIDLERPAAPQRWLPGLAARASMRFLGPGGIGADLESLAEKARAAGQLPEWAVPSECDLEGYLALLRMLREHWSTSPPQRRHRRTPTGNELLLVHGLLQARRMVAASEYARSGAQIPKAVDPVLAKKQFDKIRFGSVNPDKTTTGKLQKKEFIPPKQMLEKLELAGDKEMMQRSSVADTSDSGIGVSIPLRATWARLGVLVGYRFSDSLDWQIAIVRRISRAADHLSVGLERLIGKTQSVRFVPERRDFTATFSQIDALEGILIEGAVGLLVAPVGQYAAGQALTLGIGEGSRAARVKMSVDSGKDYRIIALGPE